MTVIFQHKMIFIENPRVICISSSFIIYLHVWLLERPPAFTDGNAAILIPANYAQQSS